MNVDRAIDVVLAAHGRGGRVFDRRSSEALVRLVITALGVSNEVRGIGGSKKPARSDGADA